MERLITSIKNQEYSNWYSVQQFPVVGALASIPVVFISAKQGLENLFKAAANWNNEDEQEKCLTSTRELAIICGNSFLNVVTLGIFNSTITWAYSIKWDAAIPSGASCGEEPSASTTPLEDSDLNSDSIQSNSREESPKNFSIQSSLTDSSSLVCCPESIADLIVEIEKINNSEREYKIRLTNRRERYLDRFDAWSIVRENLNHFTDELITELMLSTHEKQEEPELRTAEEVLAEIV